VVSIDASPESPSLDRQKKIWWPLLLAGLTTALIASVVMSLGAWPDSWAKWPAAPCAATRCFCELVRTDTLRQPINAYSSLAYTFVGFVIVFSAAAGLRIRRWYGWSLIILGLGSAFYHATLTFFGQAWDVLGLYFVGLVIIAWTLRRTWLLTWRWILMAMAALAAVSVAIIFQWPDIRRPFFAALLVLVLLSALFARWRKRPASVWPVIWAALTLAIATIIWSVDEQQSWCRIYPWFQGHSIWHLLGAAATWVYSRAIRQPLSGPPQAE